MFPKETKGLDIVTDGYYNVYKRNREGGHPMKVETKSEQAEVLAERFVETMKQLPNETLVRLCWIMKGIEIANMGKEDRK